MQRPVNRRTILIIVILLAIGATVWRFYPGTQSGGGSGRPLADVEVPALDAQAMAGEAAFNENCASCHGANAAGQDGVAPPLVHIIYVPNHHGDRSFYLAARQGVRSHHWPFGDMPPVDGISDAEIGQIVAYVRTLQRANGIN